MFYLNKFHFLWEGPILWQAANNLNKSGLLTYKILLTQVQFCFGKRVCKNDNSYRTGCLFWWFLGYVAPVKVQGHLECNRRTTCVHACNDISVCRLTSLRLFPCSFWGVRASTRCVFHLATTRGARSVVVAVLCLCVDVP